LRPFNEWLLALQVKDIASLMAWAVGAISIIIEFNKKIPLHPLSHVFKWMGSILNKETFTPADFVTKIKDILSPATKTSLANHLETTEASNEESIPGRTLQAKEGNHA